MLRSQLSKYFKYLFLVVMFAAVFVSACSSNKDGNSNPNESASVSDKGDNSNASDNADDSEDAEDAEDAEDEKERNSMSRLFTFYLKGNNLYMARRDNSEVIDLGVCTNNGSTMTKFAIHSSDYKLNWFCSFSDYDGETYTLYTSEYESPTERTKVAEQVQNHNILKNGDILYRSGNEVFLYKEGNAKSIFKEEEDMEYKLSEDEEKILVSKKVRATKENPGDIYLINIYTGETEVSSNVDTRYLYTSKDLNNKYEFKEDTLYLLKGNESQAIISGIKFPYNNISKTDMVYASKTDEPKSLYRFDMEGNEELISDSMDEFVGSDGSRNLLAYTETNAEGKTLLKILEGKELLGEYEWSGKFDEMGADEKLNRDSNYWYFFSLPDKKLCRVSLAGDTKGEMETVKDNIRRFISLDHRKSDDTLLYEVIEDGSDHFLLYLDKELINDNIGERYMRANVVEDKDVNYISYGVFSRESEDKKKYSYDLHMYEKGNDTLFLRDVYDMDGFVMYNNKFEQSYFLTDYDFEKGEGTLIHYINGEFVEVEKDVKDFLDNINISGGSRILSKV